MKRVAVVTGTTSGIGYYIASYFKNEGYYVIGINRKFHSKSSDLPTNSNFFLDLSSVNEISSAVSEFKHQYQTFEIEVLVNNAGVMYLNDFSTNDRDTIAIDFEAPIYLCKEMLLQEVLKEGHIINIASISGMVGDIDAPVYSACKAGIINLTRSLAKKYAPEIRVNCISPGFFKTNLVEGDTPQELIDQVPMMREAEAHEIIPVIHMLQVSTYMTGANIVIDGGLSL